MQENPYQAEALEPAVDSRRRRKPNAFQRTLSALFLFVGSCLSVIAAAALWYEIRVTGAVPYSRAAGHETSILAIVISVGFVAAGIWIRRSPR